MTSKEALEKLCNDCNNKMGENYTHCLHRRVCGTHCDEYKQIEKVLEVLEIINSKCFLLFSERKKLAEEYEDWCIKNNVLMTDTTNMITWLLCIKLKEWLGDE